MAYQHLPFFQPCCCVSSSCNASGPFCDRYGRGRCHPRCGQRNPGRFCKDYCLLSFPSDKTNIQICLAGRCSWIQQETMGRQSWERAIYWLIVEEKRQGLWNYIYADGYYKTRDSAGAWLMVEINCVSHTRAYEHTLGTSRQFLPRFLSCTLGRVRPWSQLPPPLRAEHPLWFLNSRHETTGQWNWCSSPSYCLHLGHWLFIYSPATVSDLHMMS